MSGDCEQRLGSQTSSYQVENHVSQCQIFGLAILQYAKIEELKGDSILVVDVVALQMRRLAEFVPEFVRRYELGRGNRR